MSIILNGLYMKILAPTPRPTTSDILGVGSKIHVLKSIPGDSIHTTGIGKIVRLHIWCHFAFKVCDLL